MILKSTLIVFFANASAHLINYLYHFVAGHYLSPNDFGLLQSFVSLNYFLAVLISSFSLTIIHQLNLTKKKDQPNLIATLQSLSLKLTLIIWLFTLLSFPLLKRILHFNNPYLLLIFSIQVLFSFLPTLYLSLLQAKLQFKQMGFINFLSPFTKTTSALILFLLGFKLYGAITAMVLAGLIPAILSYKLINKHLHLTPLTGPDPVNKLPRSFYKFGLTAFITNLSLTSLYNSDVILVRFFISHQSGIYAAASVLSRIIFFVSSAVLTVSFPIFTLHAKNKKRLKKSFQNSLFLIINIAFLGTVFYQLFPDLIVKLFSNHSYATATNILPGFSLFIFFFTILNLTIQFLLTINKRSAAIVASFTALLQLTLIFFLHHNLMQVIQSSIIATITGLTISLIFIKKSVYT